MNRRIIYNSFKADIKFIARDPMLLMSAFAPFALILILRLVFPLISGYIYSKTFFILDDYYTIIAVTMVSVIPMLYGMVYSFILLDENDMHILQVISVTPSGKRNFMVMRMIVPVFISFIMVMISIVITDPVPGEGWLRSLYVSFLLSLQAPFVFLFIGGLARNKVEGLAYSKLYGIFLVMVPLGLILHHPWNYLAFFSPLYWISWAWVTSVPLESLIYGSISMLITLGAVIVLFRHFLRKKTN